MFGFMLSQKAEAQKQPKIKEFIEIGDGMKIKLGHMYGSDQDRKNNFYERLGLKKAGIHYFSEAS